MSIEAMKQALALNAWTHFGECRITDGPIPTPAEVDAALRQAIEQAEQPAQQEPVAKYIGECSEGSLVQLYDDVKEGTNFYTSPPAQRTWVGLNEDQRQQVRNICDADIPAHVFHAIEAKLKEKNT